MLCGGVGFQLSLQPPQSCGNCYTTVITAQECEAVWQVL